MVLRVVFRLVLFAAGAYGAREAGLRAWDVLQRRAKVGPAAVREAVTRSLKQISGSKGWKKKR
jgi:hypothetical protein